jgi:hypothetical protein
MFNVFLDSWRDFSAGNCMGKFYGLSSEIETVDFEVHKWIGRGLNIGRLCFKTFSEAPYLISSEAPYLISFIAYLKWLRINNFVGKIIVADNSESIAADNCAVHPVHFKEKNQKIVLTLLLINVLDLVSQIRDLSQ